MPDQHVLLADTKTSRILILLPWLALTVSAFILILFRLHAFELPLETDECNYAYVGGRLLDGDRLYTDVWDHQPFGAFVLFASVIALFGDAPEVYRWMAVAFSLVSLLLIFSIAKNCAGPGAASLAAVLFALTSTDPGTAGEGCNREIYMNTFVLAACWFGLRALQSPERKRRVSFASTMSLGDSKTPRAGAWGSDWGFRPWSIFSAGLLLGVGSTLKTILAVHWLFLGVWIVLSVAQSVARGRRLWAVGESLLVFSFGPLLIWTASFAYFGLSGRLSEFVDAVFLFNLSYTARPGGFFGRFAQFFSPGDTPYLQPFIFDSAWPLWMGGVVSVLWLLFAAGWRRLGKTFPSKGENSVTPIVGLLAASYVATCLPAQFWPHYYYLLIPSLVLVCSVATMRVGRLLLGQCHLGEREIARAEARSSVSLRYSAAAFLYLALPLWLLYTEGKSYLLQPPFGITVNRYNSRDFWGRAQGENIAGLTNPSDEIFVFGNEAEIYYYSGRRCASRFTMITGLQSGYTGAEKRRDVLMTELRKSPPRLIVVLFDEKPFPEWRAFLEEHYGEAIGWDRHDKSGDPIMLVFARKDQPIEPIDWDWHRKSVGGWFAGEHR